MATIGEMLEERRRKQAEDESNTVINNLTSQTQDVEQKLEVLRKMIVNADVIDEAGNGINSLIEAISAQHADMVSNVGQTVKGIVEQKVMAEQAIDDMRSQVDTMRTEKSQFVDNIKTSFGKAEKKVKADASKTIDALKKTSNEIAQQNAKQAIETLNKKFDSLQTNMIDLNDTMLKVLGVLQSPKRLEFDNEGMPTGVYVE